MADASKIPFQSSQEVSVRAALQKFDDERPAFGQEHSGTSMRGLGQGHYSKVIRLCMSRCRRRHIAQDNIGLTAERLAQPLQDFG